MSDVSDKVLASELIDMLRRKAWSSIQGLLFDSTRFNDGEIASIITAVTICTAEDKAQDDWLKLVVKPILEYDCRAFSGTRRPLFGYSTGVLVGVLKASALLAEMETMNWNVMPTMVKVAINDSSGESSSFGSAESRKNQRKDYISRLSQVLSFYLDVGDTNIQEQRTKWAYQAIESFRDHITSKTYDGMSNAGYYFVQRLLFALFGRNVDIALQNCQDKLAMLPVMKAVLSLQSQTKS